jgi:aminoacrylate hydrolase
VFNSATAWHAEPWKLYQVPEFSKDFTVITYDQRGTGKSTTSSDDFSTTRLAEDVVALLDHLKIKRTVALGHSNGGRIAMTLAADFPGLVSTLILASSGTAYNGPPGVPIKMCAELIRKGYEKYTLDHVCAVGFTKAYYEANRELCDKFIAVRMSNLPSLETFLGYVVSRQESGISSKFKNINIPTLIMIGEDEDHHATGLSHLQSAKLLAEEIAGATFVMLPGQGHHYPFVAPKITNKVIREFLSA